MAILGHGIDLVEIERIRGLIQRHDQRFLNRVYTPEEQKYCGAKASSHIHYAARWAAKEAFYKALPSQVQPFAEWKMVEIVSGGKTFGQPVMSVIDPKLAEKMANAGIKDVMVSLSHERTMAIASVMMMGEVDKRPKNFRIS